MADNQRFIVSGQHNPAFVLVSENVNINEFHLNLSI